MADTASRRLEGPGAEMRVAELRAKFRAASKAAERETKSAPRREHKPKNETLDSGEPRKRDRKAQLSEREQWLQRNAKQSRRDGKGSASASQSSGGAMFWVLLLVFVGGGGGFGYVASEMGSVELAARHLAAAPHCETARLAGVAGAKHGEPGYWAHHDQGGAGVSCAP